MPANKNALIRYKTIDNCLRNRYRRWTLNDLVDACSESLYEYEGVRKGVAVRTVQADLQMMRSDKLGYNAPIEVYDHKYYRYADPSYSITNMPLSQNDYEVMQEAVDMLRQLEDFDQFAEMADVVGRLQDKLAISRSERKPVIHFDSVAGLVGLRLLNPLYNHIVCRHTLSISYQSFAATEESAFLLCPYMLKEFRNRWFLFGSRPGETRVHNLPLDRIKGFVVADEPFSDNPYFDREHYFDDVIGVTKRPHDRARHIKFRATAEQSNYIKTKPLHPSQILVDEDAVDGSCTFRITVVVNFELYSVFLSYGAGVEILTPRKVRQHMQQMVRQMSCQYDENEV